MEKYHGCGDLTDILRATGTGSSTGEDQWHHDLTSNYPFNYSCDPVDDFGDPFTHLRDPLLHEILELSTTTIVENSSGNFTNGRIQFASKNLDEMKRPIISSSSSSSSSSSIFSRMLQISPNATKSPFNSPISSRGCLVESPAGGSSLQISSPRNTGIKKRKSQAKKVVCIPAPAPANSRPSSGEIVPSDLWAWRKYGQKPIKGSPYPRGYYKCSSSKGCSARKQVERSRNDPNMLVITYTFDHNHPWPTQRNALAGSTRNYNPTKNSNPALNSKQYQNPDEEYIKEMNRENTTVDSNSATVKEEMDQDNNQFEMGDPEFDKSFTQFGYKPAMPDGSEDSFFADLGEIEAHDPLGLLFNQEFSSNPFETELDYWAGNNINTTTSATGTTEATKRLGY